VAFITDNTGQLVSLVFLLSCIAVAIPVPGRSRRLRIIIPVFLIVYIALISAFTGSVARYIEVIVPLIWLHLCAEINTFAVLLDKKYIKPARLNILLVLLCPALVIGGSPGFFYKKTLFASNPQLEVRLGELREVIDKQPVFTQFPYFAYKVGGQYRQLPNDSLGKIVRYGNLTGVDWLLLVDVPEQREVSQYWDKAYVWMKSGNLEQNFPKFVSLYTRWHDNNTNTDWSLYKLHSSEN